MRASCEGDRHKIFLARCLDQRDSGLSLDCLLARPSWPLVAMITVVAAITVTALKIRNLVVFDAGTMS